MFWYLLRPIFFIYTKIYFRRSNGKNLKNLRVKNPVLIAINHPNAFADPIALSCTLYSPRTFYMARGDAFKKGIISSILTATGIIPIFRMRDAGIEGVKKNNESFSIAYRIWNKGHKIMVFAEGLCIQERRLRSIQKGTARMAFGFMEEYKRDDFLIIPVSVNYSNPAEFRSDVYFTVGEPIAIKDFRELYKENPAKGVNQLTKVLESKMLELTPHLTHPENDILAEELQPIFKHQYIEENGFQSSNPEHQQAFWMYMIGRLNSLTEQQPEQVEKLRALSSVYTRKLAEQKIQDLNVYKSISSNNTYLSSLLLLILGFPFYAIGKLLNFIPWYAAKSVAKKAAKNIEFYTSVNFVVGLFLSGLYFLAELLALWLIFRTAWSLVAYTLLKVVLSLIALQYSARKKEWLGAIRWKGMDPAIREELISKRAEILSILTGK